MQLTVELVMILATRDSGFPTAKDRKSDILGCRHRCSKPGNLEWEHSSETAVVVLQFLWLLHKSLWQSCLVYHSRNASSVTECFRCVEIGAHDLSNVSNTD